MSAWRFAINLDSTYYCHQNRCQLLTPYQNCRSLKYDQRPLISDYKQRVLSRNRLKGTLDEIFQLNTGNISTRDL